MATMPNPRYEDLRHALMEVKARVAVLEAALDSPYQQFAGGQVWVGPAARSFGDELSSRRARLRATAQAIVADLEEELRATPRQGA
ncbi:hypothetical protein J5X84_01345 [Streptosporangiaceae bacterium NEAU-GS5]|nr:hypothetical protein [Streptosporangiaceae bacterium NEAU-GS5]